MLLLVAFWRGLGPHASRQQRAVVTFAQNTDTARVIRTWRRLRVLSNATSVDVRRHPSHRAPRRSDIIFAARLLPWKGGRLAVRAIRYVRHPDAVLRIFGDGPERRRIARLRDDGVSPTASVSRAAWTATNSCASSLRLASSFIRPFMMRPVSPSPKPYRLARLSCVSIGRSARAPASLARGVRRCRTPQSPERTARALAAAIDRFLSNPPPVPDNSRRSVIVLRR